ncbi:hypothetical protein LUZ61_017662 [Rhynchospora tenuis]|uniref:Rapid alkalinization factor 1 n=1 Tax=Rhynchospora tenuis TaxID=198213 RepID=A0AAD5Z7V8_9POAL|nr:hypothetical protein LUZ61_017662 [Rhynchospora tenuis]
MVFGKSNFRLVGDVIDLPHSVKVRDRHRKTESRRTYEAHQTLAASELPLPLLAMAKLVLLIPLLLLLLSLTSPTLSLHTDLPLSAYGLSLASSSRCSGDSLGECLEDEMDDTTTRRFLAGSLNYISYGALRRDTVPCSRRGASYYNCRPGGQANPYRRGCSAITRCRGFIIVWGIVVWVLNDDLCGGWWWWW